MLGLRAATTGFAAAIERRARNFWKLYKSTIVLFLAGIGVTAALVAYNMGYEAGRAAASEDVELERFHAALVAENEAEERYMKTDLCHWRARYGLVEHLDKPSEAPSTSSPSQAAETLDSFLPGASECRQREQQEIWRLQEKHGDSEIPAERKFEAEDVPERVIAGERRQANDNELQQ